MTMVLCCPGSVELVLFSVRPYLSVFYFHGKPLEGVLLVTTGVSIYLFISDHGDAVFTISVCLHVYMYTCTRTIHVLRVIETAAGNSACGGAIEPQSVGSLRIWN